MEPSTRTDDVVNRVFIRGADGLKATVANGAFQAGFQKERRVFLPALENSAEALLFGTAYFARYGTPQPSGRLVLGGWEDALEAVGPPVGKARVVGGPQFVKQGTRLGAQLDMQLGGAVGTAYEEIFRLDSINYRPMDDGLRVDVTLGERRNALTDLLRAIEFKLSNLVQKQSRGTGTGDINPDATSTLGSFVSVPGISFTTETELASVTLVTIGSPVRAVANVNHLSDDTGAGGASSSTYRLKRDGVVLKDATIAGAITIEVSIAEVDTPPAGTHTYTLTGERLSGPSTPLARQRRLILLEQKR